MKIIPVILSGGGGTRLWPMSTLNRPKQFLPLTGDGTMFEKTLARTMDRNLFEAPLVVSGATHAAIVAEQLLETGITDALQILEPCARNTAPAIALAALAMADANDAMLVMPSDHVIADAAAFQAAVQAALPLVDAGWLVTFGINPTGPETGYGYIRMGEILERGVRKVDRFVEKPKTDAALKMIADGNHSWNGGIFLFRADAYLGALSIYAPDILAAVQQSMELARTQEQQILPDAEAFSACPSDSIDYAVLEKSDRVAVVPVAMGWSDVGSWDALYDIGSKDGDGNQIGGDARLIASTGNLIRTDGIRINAAGVHDLIIVAVGNEVMIVPRGQSQDVKKFSG